MHYYQFNISDWALHTSHLTLEEEGIYRRILDHYYDSEKPIPEETQPVIRRLRLANHSVPFGLILSEFFLLEADGWHNHRADIEIKEYHHKAEVARLNGKKGGRPKKKTPVVTEPITQPVILANPEETQTEPSAKLTKNYELPTTNQELQTSNQEPSSSKDLSAKADIPKKKVKQFVAPTQQQVADYMLEKKHADPVGQSHRFTDYYESNGWRVSKSPMKDWKASARNWMRNNFASGGSVGQQASGDSSMAGWLADAQPVEKEIQGTVIEGGYQLEQF